MTQEVWVQAQHYKMKSINITKPTYSPRKMQPYETSPTTVIFPCDVPMCINTLNGYAHTCENDKKYVHKVG
jgi:hypothetical protein